MISALALVRHGESQWNAKGLWTGWQDIPLSEKGKKEARLAALAIQDVQFHLAFSSDLVRAWETLEIIKEELEPPKIIAEKDSAFRERHYGIFTGKNKWHILKEVGKEMFKAIRRGWDVPIESGETLKDVYNRVIPKFKQNILPRLKQGNNILFVAHGNSNRVLIKHLENISNSEISDIEMETGEVWVYSLNQKGRIIKKEKRKV